MKELPKLIKNPDRKYTIGIDVANEGNTEIFTFCVQYYDGKIFCIEQMDSIINSVDYATDSPTEKYVQQLAEHYNAPIYRGY